MGATSECPRSLLARAHQEPWMWTPGESYVGIRGLVPGQLVATRASWLGSCSWRARSGEPRACTCCLGCGARRFVAQPVLQADLRKLGNVQRPPFGPTPPLGAQTETGQKEDILTPTLPHGRWSFWGGGNSWEARSRASGLSPPAATCLPWQLPWASALLPSSNGGKTWLPRSLRWTRIMRVERLVFRRVQIPPRVGKKRGGRTEQSLCALTHGLQSPDGRDSADSFAAVGCTGPAHGPHFCPGAPRETSVCARAAAALPPAPQGRHCPQGSDWSEGSEAHRGMRAKARSAQDASLATWRRHRAAGGSREAVSPWGSVKGGRRSTKTT